MSTGNAAAEALKPVAAAAAPGWRVQFGLLVGADVPTDRFVVLRPIGGGGPGRLVRRPLISVMFVGAIGEASAVCSLVAEAFMAALIAGAAGGAYSEAAEPVVMQTSDGRPVMEMVVSSIVSL